jgi:aminobenzoyl-glutamate utilization protein B
MLDKIKILDMIDGKKDIYIKASDKIWELAEIRYKEFNSAELLCKILEAEGFTVEKNIGYVPNAFVGSFGKEGPVIAILGEYDALAGLSQKGGIAHKEAIVNGGSGHGCGHNLLGAGSLAAAVAVKDYLSQNKIPGTIRYYGCPGEEGGSGKTFMVREGVFAGVDAALTWHPTSFSGVFSPSTLANYQIKYKFHGKSAHAANPHLGRSALDAVELMNVGVNFLREHIIQEARISYSIINAGGISPNVVQPEAEVLYLIRALNTPQVQEIYERVCNIARGAAMMTGTECEIVFEKACSNYVPSNILGNLLYENLKEVGIPQFDEQDVKYAREIQSTLSSSEIDYAIQELRSVTEDKGRELNDYLKDKVLSDMIIPYRQVSSVLPGSTDVGDVSWLIPTAQIWGLTFALGTPYHSWQMVAQGTTDLAHKGMLNAGKVLAMTAVDLYIQPEIIKKAKEDLKEQVGGKTYFCPIPSGVKPSAS